MTRSCVRTRVCFRPVCSHHDLRVPCACPAYGVYCRQKVLKIKANASLACYTHAQLLRKSLPQKAQSRGHDPTGACNQNLQPLMCNMTLSSGQTYSSIGANKLPRNLYTRLVKSQPRVQHIPEAKLRGISVAARWADGGGGVSTPAS